MGLSKMQHTLFHGRKKGKRREKKSPAGIIILFFNMNGWIARASDQASERSGHIITMEKWLRSGQFQTGQFPKSILFSIEAHIDKTIFAVNISEESLF